MMGDSLMGWFNSPKKSQKIENFASLRFSLPEGWSCDSKTEEKWECRPKGSNNELVFESRNLLSSESLPLLKMLRKREWEKQTLNQYVEEKLSSALGVHQSQRAIYYRLNNISSPVLIRAFDVVIDENTCVSITSQCDVPDCPVLEKEVTNLVSSFSRTAKK